MLIRVNRQRLPSRGTLSTVLGTDRKNSKVFRVNFGRMRPGFAKDQRGQMG
jgi:hypothetical protein